MGKIYYKGTAAVSLIRQRSDRHTQAADDTASGGSVRHLRAELPCADVSGGRDCRSGGAETEGVSARQVKTRKKFVRRRNDPRNRAARNRVPASRMRVGLHGFLRS